MAGYWLAVAVGVLAAIAVCVLARRSAAARMLLGRGIALVLLADAITFFGRSGFWHSGRTDLPLNLCDLALLIAALACWWPHPLAVELTWFWGMAGTLQAVITPDLSASARVLDFWLFVVGHLGIVIAALYLVIGCRLRPRPGAVRRVFLVTLTYAVVVGAVDAVTGSNYMFLRRVPAHASLLSVLGPWPWYIVSAAAVAVVLFAILDAPFRLRPDRDQESVVVAERP